MAWLKRHLTPERVRFIQFCVVGASGVAVNLAVFAVFRYWLLDGLVSDDDRAFMAANFAGFLVSVLTNFLLNDFWTWGDRKKTGHAHFWRRLVKFYIVSSLAGGVQLVVAATARSSLGMMDELAVLVGIGAATVINYGVNNVWTFREKKA